jgi:hypothetical protein
VKCETKPISGGERLGDRLSKQTQSGVPRREEGCHREQTKPTLGDLGYLENGVEGLAQTNPIWRDARGGLPPRACAGRLYKQTQFRRAATGLAVQTNPICPRRMGRRGRGWSLCAKQTQLPEAGHRGGVGRGGLREPPIVPVFQHSRPMPIVQNKANLGPIRPTRWTWNPPPHAGHTHP